MRQRIINISKALLPFGLRITLRKINWWRYYVQQSLFGASRAPVYCPIARRTFRRFIHLRGDLISPSNGARSRQRLIWTYLLNELRILDVPRTVLHIAPEFCFREILRSTPGLTYVAGDKMVQGYGRQSDLVELDITQLAFGTDRFDLILCNHVLEHVPDDATAMGELFRVLKPGGVAVVTVPIDDRREKTFEDPSIVSPTERKRHFGQWDHVRWYAPDIADRFATAGFRVEMNKYGQRFPAEEYARLGLCDDTLIIARKPAR